MRSIHMPDIMYMRSIHMPDIMYMRSEELRVANNQSKFFLDDYFLTLFLR